MQELIDKVNKKLKGTLKNPDDFKPYSLTVNGNRLILYRGDMEFIRSYSFENDIEGFLRSLL